MPSVSNVMGNAWKVTVDGTELAFTANVQMGGLYTLEPIKSQKTMDDILGKLVRGRQGLLKFDIIETENVPMLAALGLSAAGDALDLGAQLPAAPVLLHPATLDDATETFDLYFYSVAFGMLERTANGQGVATWTTTGEAMRDSNGKVWRYGPAA